MKAATRITFSLLVTLVTILSSLTNVQYAEASPQPPPASRLGNFAIVPSASLTYLHPIGPGVRVGDSYYVISGQIASRGVVTPQVERTHILPDGNITSWDTVGTLRVARDQATAAATSDRIYIVGQHPGNTMVTSIPILPDGSLGTERTERSMQIARYSAGAFAHGGYLYAVGGRNNSVSPYFLASMERAIINGDGSLGPWEIAPSLNTARMSFALVGNERYVWVLGGYSASGRVGMAERAELLPDGSIGDWQNAGTVPGRGYPGALIIGDSIFYVGGSGDSGDTNTAYSIPILSSGELGTAFAEPLMVNKRSTPKVFNSNTYLYITAGEDYTGAAINGWKTTERAPLLFSAPAPPTSLVKISPDNNVFPAFKWNSVAGDVTYEVKMDAGNWTDIGNHLTYVQPTMLNQGTHSFSVRAKNTAGLVSQSANLSFSVSVSANLNNTRFAFNSDRDGNLEIYVMNYDGSGLKRLTDNPAIDTYPAISPDGTKVAFSSDRYGAYDIFVVDVNTLELTRLTSASGHDVHASWSYDGGKIAFTSQRDGHNEVYTMDANGDNQMRLTESWESVTQPASRVWSPDGTKIVYSSRGAGIDWGDVYTINVEGTGKKRLTDNAAGKGGQGLSWSPDGTRIAFMSLRNGTPGIGPYQIYVMNSENGSEQEPLTDTSSNNFGASWSPDVTRIAFSSERNGGVSDIYLMNALDGSEQTRRTDNPAFDGYVSWSDFLSNAAPTAANDSYTVNEDTSLVISGPGILANDTDPDGNPLTAFLVTPPAHGTLTFNGTGSFSYTPHIGFTGADSFTYEVNDGLVDSNTAYVAIIINAVLPPAFLYDKQLPTDNASICLPPFMVVDPSTTHLWWSRATGDGTLEITLVGIAVNPAESGNVTMAVINPSGLVVDTRTVVQPASGEVFATPVVISGATAGSLYKIAVRVAAPPQPTQPARHYRLSLKGASLLGANTPLQAQAENHDAVWAVHVAAGENFNIMVQPGPEAPATTGNVTIRDPGNAVVTTVPIGTPVNITSAAPGTWTINIVGADHHYIINKTSGTDRGVYVNWQTWGHGHLSGSVIPPTEGIIRVTSTATGVSKDYSVDATAGTYSVPDKELSVATYTVQFVEPGGASPARTINVTCNSNYIVNFSAPVTVDDSYSTSEDTTLNVSAPGVLGNDSDADGDPITAVLVNPLPAHGTVILNSDGSFTYTPSANFSGVDNFYYKASDGGLQSQYPGANVTIYVIPVNDAPVANPDSYSTNEDTTLTVAASGVLVNDTDVDGNSLTAAVVSGPSHGTLTLNTNGSFTYTPAANYNGPDSFTYKANDGTADSGATTVSITVSAVNDAPVAVNDAYPLIGNSSLTILAPGVLMNDQDDNPLTVSLVTGPNYGSLVLNPDGSFTYNPNGFIGTVSFTYRANDGTTDSNVATVTITVTMPPTAINGKITAGVLQFANNGRGGFNVQSDAKGVMKGELEYHNGTVNLHAKTMTAIAVSPDRTKGWFAGELTDRRKFNAYVEDNGESGAKNAPVDVFKLWVNGVLQNDVDGKLTGGNIQIHK